MNEFETMNIMMNYGMKDNEYLNNKFTINTIKYTENNLVN